MSLTGRVCLVTGASRGIGKGIALQLGEAGATVYITGRTLQKKPGGQSGSLEETAQEVQDRGGHCIPVQCDHTKDSDIESLFTRIKEEQNGRLDLLVNNAYSAVNTLVDAFGKKFWELQPAIWDDVNAVGLRNHYICTVYATRMMVEQGSGMIVWVSSGGGLRYLFNVAYGVGKAACDRMAADCGFELSKKNICCVSLWPGLVKTENFKQVEESRGDILGGNSLKIGGLSESPEYSGKAVVKLMEESDSQRRKRNGKVVVVADLADQFGMKDVDGSRPLSMLSIAYWLTYSGYTKLAYCIPRWLKVPKWMLTMAGHKF